MPPPGAGGSTFARFPPPADGKGTPTWVWIVVAVVGTLALAGVVGALAGGDTGADGPKDERAFISIVKDGQDAAGNEVAVHKASEKRAEDLCGALPADLKVTDWVGTIDDVDTTSGGDSGVLNVNIAEGVNVTTWNNGLSDIGDHTLIDPDSEVYDALAELDEGATITFSGEFVDDDEDCVSEQSLFETNGMKHPAFVFRFSAVQPK